MVKKINLLIFKMANPPQITCYMLLLVILKGNNISNTVSIGVAFVA
jgi:hypothetical protein